MQAIILAAGMGSRLGKYTRCNTKCMLKIHGRTLIELALDKLNNVGIRKVVMVVGYKREKLQKFIGNNYKNIDIEYVVNPVYDKTNNIYSLFLAKEYLLKDDTLLLESDLIFEEKILKDLLENERNSLSVVDKYESWMDGTVVKLDNQDRIVSFIPKKDINFNELDQYYKTVNIHKFSKKFSQNTYVPFLEAYSKALGNNEYYEQVLRVIVKLENQELRAMRLNGEKWYEIDDAQDKDNAETIFAPDEDTKLELMQRRYGGYWRYSSIKDFCYLTNPFFPNTELKNEIKAYFDHLLTEYPSGLDVQNLLAGMMFGVEEENIVVGNGAAELIKSLSKSITGTFGLTFPTFNEYPETLGYERVVKYIPANDNFTYDVDDLYELSLKCDNLILINPDNPSGNFISKRKVLLLLDKLQKDNKRLIVDESFVDFSGNSEENTLIVADILMRFNNLIIIKSISKSYGVPGLRLGVLASSNQELMKKVKSNLSIWNINSFGEFFLQIINKYKNEYAEGCDLIIEERNWFFEELKALSFLRVIPSEANYFLCEVVNRFSATELTKELLFRYDIFVKDLTGKIGFEGKEYVRIAVRERKDNEFISKCLKELNDEI